jgi:hypothetical protein
LLGNERWAFGEYAFPGYKPDNDSLEGLNMAPAESGTMRQTADDAMRTNLSAFAFDKSRLCMTFSTMKEFGMIIEEKHLSTVALKKHSNHHLLSIHLKEAKCVRLESIKAVPLS